MQDVLARDLALYSRQGSVLQAVAQGTDNLRLIMVNIALMGLKVAKPETKRIEGVYL